MFSSNYMTNEKSKIGRQLFRDKPVILVAAG